jgi:7-cyano-7-deazaguanine synthase
VDDVVVTNRLLLLSGGVDSAALATSLRPAQTLFVNYGQRPAEAEAAAAAAIASELGLAHAQIDVDLSSLGGGLLANDEPLLAAPSPEWWPFRNQLLVSFAAAWAVRNGSPGATEVITGTVAADGARHLDGTAIFYSALDTLLRAQEGDISAAAPAIRSTTVELVRSSGIEDAVLAWTHSCHRANIPCMDCPGCFKREQVLAELDRLQ